MYALIVRMKNKSERQYDWNSSRGRLPPPLSFLPPSLYPPFHSQPYLRQPCPSLPCVINLGKAIHAVVSLQSFLLLLLQGEQGVLGLGRGEGPLAKAGEDGADA